MSRLLITTSREPSRRTRSFVKDLSRVLPHSVRVTRGKATYGELAVKASSLGAYGVLVAMEKRGNPSALSFLRVEGSRPRREFLLKLGRVSLLGELPGSQLPLGMLELVIVPGTLPRGFPETVAAYLLECLRPRVVERSEGRVVELRVLGGEEGALVTFICATSERECGPRFTVVRVVDYLRQVKIP